MLDKSTLMQREATFRGIVKLIGKRELPEKYPAFVPVLESLNNKLAKIKSLQCFRSDHINSESKKKMRKTTCKAAHTLSCAVYAYAQITGNIVLKNAVHYTFSDFYRPKEETMIGRFRQVINASKKIKNPGQFGLTPLVIEKFSNLFKQYLEYTKKPVQNIKQAARSTRQVSHLLDDCLDIVQKQIYPLIVVVNETELRLLAEYNIYRKFKKASGRKRKYIKKQKPQQTEKSAEMQVVAVKTPANKAIKVHQEIN